MNFIFSILLTILVSLFGVENSAMASSIGNDQDPSRYLALGMNRNTSATCVIGSIIDVQFNKLVYFVDVEQKKSDQGFVQVKFKYGVKYVNRKSLVTQASPALKSTNPEMIKQYQSFCSEYVSSITYGSSYSVKTSGGFFGEPFTGLPENVEFDISENGKLAFLATVKYVSESAGLFANQLSYQQRAPFKNISFSFAEKNDTQTIVRIAELMKNAKETPQFAPIDFEYSKTPEIK